jgi:hypothetical protein
MSRKEVELDFELEKRVLDKFSKWFWDDAQSACLMDESVEESAKTIDKYLNEQYIKASDVEKEIEQEENRHKIVMDELSKRMQKAKR